MHVQQLDPFVEEIHDIRAFRLTGDRDAAHRIFLRYEARLLGYIHRIMQHPQDAEDVLQRTFQKAFSALPTFEGEKYFKSWLFRIAHNESINAAEYRQRRSTGRDPEAPECLPSDLSNGFIALDQKERSSELHRAILDLPEREREVVLLRLEANLPFREIAEIADAPLGTVLARMHSAKRRLKEALQTKGIDHEI